jgi:hypothetical protein
MQSDFDHITQIKTGFAALDEVIAKTKKREHGLLGGSSLSICSTFWKVWMTRSVDRYLSIKL